jgi:hypothetical protein
MGRFDEKVTSELKEQEFVKDNMQDYIYKGLRCVFGNERWNGNSPLATLGYIYLCKANLYI